jgi:hypothetical protein
MRKTQRAASFQDFLTISNFFVLKQLNFEDVLAEPDVSHGFDPIWRSSYVLFTGSRYWIYRLLAALFALPLALVWGITFSLITFFSVWFATPALRILDVVLFYVRRVIKMIIINKSAQRF